MPILDKEGKVYKLRGPNPMMSNQDIWDKKRVKLYNLAWNSEFIDDPYSDKAKFLREHPSVDIAEEYDLKSNAEWIPPFEFVDELNKSKPKKEPEPVLAPKTEPEPVEQIKETPKQLSVSTKVARIFQERGLEFHCAPVIQVLMKDELYGHQYSMNRYGDKFIFDGVVIEENDMELIYWCVREMTKGSVIMPKRTESRWWRIEEVNTKSGGYVVRAIPSDVNPSFEN